MTPSTRLFHAPLVASGATLLIAALVTDVLYWRTALTQWENFSIWLITGGLLLAAVASLALLLDLAFHRAADALAGFCTAHRRRASVPAQRLRSQPRRVDGGGA